MVSQNICRTTFRSNEMTTEHITSAVTQSEQIYSAKSPKSCKRVHRSTMTSTQLFLTCVVILISITTASIQEEGISCTALAFAMPGLLTLQGEKMRFANSSKELSNYHLPTQYSHPLTFVIAELQCCIDRFGNQSLFNAFT